MKLLIYGFEPYGKNTRNISQLVLNNLRKRQSINKIVLPVVFKSSELLNAVKELKPTVILGLGQYPRGHKIRIERLAKNQRKIKNQSKSIISKSNPSKVLVTLKLKADSNSWVSYDARSYVCNFSMYILLTDKLTKNIPFAFLHIPKKMDVATATQFVENKIKEISLLS